MPRFQSIGKADANAIDMEGVLAEAFRRYSTSTDESVIPIWTPMPAPEGKEKHSQHEALESLADEIYYGGAGGGGKSDLLLGLALTRHSKSILFRKTFPQLRTLIARSREIVGDRGDYNKNESTWVMPDGRTLEFASMELDTDKFKYQGRDHDLKAYDEVTQFTEDQVTYTSAWARTPNPNQRVRVVMTGNPPATAEGRWIIRRYAPWIDTRFPNPAKPGEIRWTFITADGKEEWVESDEPRWMDGNLVKPRSRTFIPAYVQDNIYYRETGYISTLSAIRDTTLRRQLLFGDFSIALEDQEGQVVPTQWVEDAMNRWRTAHPPSDLMTITAMGIDPAHGGEDRTVIFKRYGTYFCEPEIVPGAKTPDGNSVVMLVVFLSHGQRPAIVIDKDGSGATAFEALAREGWPVHGVVHNSRWSHRSRQGGLVFGNMRAGLWWNMREVLDPDYGDNICLPPNDDLFRELTAPLYEFRTNGIYVEGKPELRKRLGVSTDVADACCYTALATSGDFMARQITFGWKGKQQSGDVRIKVKRNEPRLLKAGEVS